MVLFKSEAKEKALWKLGRVVGKIIGKDGGIRELKLRQENAIIVERPLQLHCNSEIGGESLAQEQKCSYQEWGQARGPKRLPISCSKSLLNKKLKMLTDV